MAVDDAWAAYAVTGRRRNGTVTYLCPDADWARRKLRDFEHAGYTAIAVTDASGRAVTLPAREDGKEDAGGARPTPADA